MKQTLFLQYVNGSGSAGRCTRGLFTPCRTGSILNKKQELRGACIEACPYEAVYLDQKREAAVKCDLCSARTAINLKPACVASCPGKAIYAGELKEIEAAIELRRKAFISID